MSSNKYDAILVLGINEKKSSYGKRVRKAVFLYKRKIAPKIIFSGRWWGGLKVKPKITEAKLMSEYAILLGAERRNIFLEQKSKSTLGNFYFTKKLILEPNGIKKLLVVQHPAGFAKAKYCAKKILGPKYSVTFITDGNNLSFGNPKRLQKIGHKSLDHLKKVFGHLSDGNDRGAAVIMAKHPFYERTKL